MYNFRFGINIIKNIGMLLFSLVTPISSVTAFMTFKNNEFVRLLMIVCTGFFFVSCICYGLWYSKQYSTIWTMALFTVCASFPMIFLNHVSELYTYNMMPFVSVLVGISLGEILVVSKTHIILKNVATVVVVLLFMGHISAVRSKTFLMKENGERALMFLNKIRSLAGNIPTNGQLLLVNNHQNYMEYSDFLVNGFNVLGSGEDYIKKITDRNDIKITIMDEINLEQRKYEGNVLILSSEGETIEIYPREGKK